MHFSCHVGLELQNSAGIPSIPAALPEGRDLMADTISHLLAVDCGMLLAGESFCGWS